MRKAVPLIYKRSPPEKMLSQCAKCKAVAIKLQDGRIVMQGSIVEFSNLPAKDCYSCSKK